MSDDFVEHPEGAVSLGTAAAHVAHVSIDRPGKRNGFTPKMVAEMSDAYTRADADPDVRVVLLSARGGHFTGGLDLPRMSEAGLTGRSLFDPALVDPVGLFGRRCGKPVVVAVEGVCYTLGIELILASEIAVAAEDARFSQIEVLRGIMPYGGATIRMAQRFGWGNAMRWLLTGDVFDAATALRLGLVQELTPPGGAFEAALAIARRIADASPIAVQASLANARLASRAGEADAVVAIGSEIVRIARSGDAAEGVAAFRERRQPRFEGN